HGDTVQINFNPVSGVVGTGFSGRLFLLTGGANHTYWPSALVEYNDKGEWEGKVHVGDRSPEATITLISADDLTTDYIEFYTKHANVIGHTGFPSSHEPKVLDSVVVHVDLMPLRERFMRSYQLIGTNDAPTGEIVDVTVSGGWALELVCSKEGIKKWE